MTAARWRTLRWELWCWWRRLGGLCIHNSRGIHPGPCGHWWCPAYSVCGECGEVVWRNPQPGCTVQP